MHTALDFSYRDEAWVRRWTAKPYYEIWQELNGRHVLPLNTEEKRAYGSITKSKTFTPPSSEKDYVFSQLARNIEAACMKARRYDQEPTEVAIFLKSQQFRVTGLRVTLSRPSAFPHEVIDAIRPAFEHLFHNRTLYRSTGVHLLKLQSIEKSQMDLFGGHVHVTKMCNLYDAVDKVRTKYGKNTLHLGASHKAHHIDQHHGKRGELAQRKHDLLPGETPRRRIGIPLFMGEVI